MLETLFCKPVRDWFEECFEGPTEAQSAAWLKIASGAHTLLAAPTGSGKTLAAFLCVIDELVRRSQAGPLPTGVQVLYVSPLKALSNDIHRNLETPLAGIEEQLARAGLPPSGIRTALRTGDTPPGERQKMIRRPPQILVTTPESLFLLLTADSGRAMLAGVEHVIVDEIHAVAGSKRGAHLALSLARLDALCAPQPPRRIGLSATQKPIEAIGAFLTGGEACAIVDTGHRRAWDLALELTGSPLTPVLANEAWEEIYDRLAELTEGHRTTLIFVNTRRLAERVARHLAERLGEEAVTAHHGSLARRHRLESEQALKAGRLRALVATASLELGIDVGHVDLVCQLGSPGSLAAFLQRVGRSGHRVGATPRGRLFPLTRDDLVECVALLRAMRAGELDAIRLPDAPLDVLAQQLVAEVAAREWASDALFERFQQAWPYRELTRDDFDAVVDMLAEGYTSRRGRRGAWLFQDAVNGRLRGRPGARLTALQNGGAIPDQFDYDVILMPQGRRIGSLGEDFAFESVPGDIFQLGAASYRVLRTSQGRVLVEDARGQPPNLPFWFGDRPGRSDELSLAVSRLREEVERCFEDQGPAEARDLLLAEGYTRAAVEQLVDYLYASWRALGCLPLRNRIVLERFFDDTGDMHLVLHAPLGSRLMRAWGLSLRKRFCRQFNFELQAAALEDSLVLSLGETHSFELEEPIRYLKPETVEQVLVQALLDAPMFEARWRWNATIALAVQRMRNGRKVPAQWQRNQAEDLVSVVFPDQIACAENLAGAREVPNHPLVRQTIEDCLRETMDIDGLVDVLERLEAGEVEVRSADLTAPSPLSREVINARPYAFLDDGEAETRRTRAIGGGPDDLGSAATLRILSVAAREQVRDEAWITPRHADELHDALLQLGFLAESEFRTGNSVTGAAGNAARWGGWFQLLAEEGRACRLQAADGASFWVAAERLPELRALHPGAKRFPNIAPPNRRAREWDSQEALVALLRDRLAGLGAVTLEVLARSFAVPAEALAIALTELQGRGYAIRLEQAEDAQTWCERRLLARIHRYSRERRRQAVKPVTPEAYLRFLARWHSLDEPPSDARGLDAALGQLEGWAAPLENWLQGLLPARCRSSGRQNPGGDLGETLDQRLLSGRLSWFRPELRGTGGRQPRFVAASPLILVPRAHLDAWRGGPATSVDDVPRGGDRTPDADSVDQDAAQQVLAVLSQGGALFTDDLERITGRSRCELKQALRCLVHRGLVTADALALLRWLLLNEANAARRRLCSGGRAARKPVDRQLATPMGRWSALQPLSSHAVGGFTGEANGPGTERARQARMAVICLSLLRRYGVVFRAVLQREPLLPPWRDLLRYYRRMEDRGEVRGGRFVDGFSGEQFALPEAVGRLRQCRTASPDPSLVLISATDPLNLGGIVVPGPKTPAQAGHQILLQDGLPVARLVGGELETLPGINERTRAAILKFRTEHGAGMMSLGGRRCLDSVPQLSSA